jgi:hypothetical protein
MSAKTREAYAKYTAPPSHVCEAQSDIFVLFALDPAAYRVVTLMTRALIEHAHDEEGT